MHWRQWWAKSNRDSIQSRFESQRRFDSKITRFDSGTMRFDIDSIQVVSIWFKRNAIWTEMSKSWVKLNTHSHYSLHNQILSSSILFYPSLIYARKKSLSVIIRGGFERRSMHVTALLRKLKFQWIPLAGTNEIQICLLKPFRCFGIWHLILRFGVWGFKILVWYSTQDLTFGLKIWISVEEHLRL